MFRFSIRELMLVTLVVGLGLGWLGHWQAMERRHARRTEYIEALKDNLRYSLAKNHDYMEAFMNPQKQGFFNIHHRKAKLPDDLEIEP